MIINLEHTLDIEQRTTEDLLEEILDEMSLVEEAMAAVRAEMDEVYAACEQAKKERDRDRVSSLEKKYWELDKQRVAELGKFLALEKEFDNVGEGQTERTVAPVETPVIGPPESIKEVVRYVLTAKEKKKKKGKRGRRRAPPDVRHGQDDRFSLSSVSRPSDYPY